MKWHGPSDAVSLRDIRQCGATGVVTTLEMVPTGDICETSDILARKALIEKAGLKWDVIESLPIHEDIKLGRGDRPKFIENYKTSLKNLAVAGVTTVAYNFMPLLDWVRTDWQFLMEDGSYSTSFDLTHFAAFDIFFLERNPENYAPAIRKKACDFFESLNPDQKKYLYDNIEKCITNHPYDRIDLDEFKERLKRYKGLTREELADNLYFFLKAVLPVAEEYGVNLTLHPDDPPFDLFGIPRLASNLEDLEAIFEKIPSPNNGLCFCSGALGSNPKNDLLQIVQRFKNRIHYLHLRSVETKQDGYFYETDHLEGDVDLVPIIAEFAADERILPMRPDHGHTILDDLNKEVSPGYGCLGRMKGLRAIMGMELAIQRQNRVSLTV